MLSRLVKGFAIFSKYLPAKRVASDDSCKKDSYKKKVEQWNHSFEILQNRKKRWTKNSKMSVNESWRFLFHPQSNAIICAPRNSFIFNFSQLTEIGVFCRHVLVVFCWTQKSLFAPYDLDHAWWLALKPLKWTNDSYNYIYWAPTPDSSRSIYLLSFFLPPFFKTS